MKPIFVIPARGGSKGMDVMPPLIVHNPDGSYSDAVLRLYGKR